ncbi:MAG: DUF1552 domain-containing protein [Pirellulales bacterium]
MNIPRRTILRAAGSAVALPMLESLGWQRSASAAAAAPRPKRLLFLGFGYGVTNETWFPDKKQPGPDYALSAGLQPLARHKQRFTLIQGLSHKNSTEGHWGSTFWLTGASRYGKPGSSFSNTISVDQVAARQWGEQTRYASLQLDTDKAAASGHGVGLSLAWDAEGKPMAGLTTPVMAFHKLFSAESMPLEERQALIASKRSVLDALRADAARVKRGVSTADARKLDEYFESIRDIENRLAREEQWLSVPKPKAEGVKEPQAGASGLDEINLMYDLAVAAFRTDSTRVIGYRQPVGSLLQGMGIGVEPHSMSHYVPGDTRKASEDRDRKQSELLAGLLDRLLATKEPDGSSLFDHTTVVYGSNIRTIHYLDNCPTIVAGGGSGIRLGEHAVFPDKTPLCNLWLTLLQGSGVEVDSHGDSTGPLDRLTS